MPVLEAMPAVTPETRSKGSVTADTALRLRLAIMPGFVTASSFSSLHHLKLQFRACSGFSNHQTSLAYLLPNGAGFESFLVIS